MSEGSPATVEFKVNGRMESITAHPLTRLLDVLRERLRLTGTKEGCGEGECGACAVLVDGNIVNSCLIPIVQLRGVEVTTIEGLAAIPEAKVVQRAFIECGGAQCGICTPGMIVAACTLLKQHPNPTDDDLHSGLAGNLCRCTGYTRIFEAIKLAAGNLSKATTR